MGTGPFKLVEWDRTQMRVILERFDDYWRGPAKIKRVIIWTIEDWSTRRAMLEKGDADFAAVPSQYLPQVENMPGVVITKGLPVISITSLHFNWNVKPDSKYIGSGKLDGNGIPPDFFSDEHARRAFAYVINYDAVIKDVLRGLGSRVPADFRVACWGTIRTFQNSSSVSRKQLKSSRKHGTVRFGRRDSSSHCSTTRATR